MKFSLAAFADEADGKIQNQIRAMKRNEIEYLEIRGVDGENIADITIEKAKEVRKQLSDAGISVWSLGSPFGKIGIGDDFNKHLDSFKYGLEKAYILGAKNIRIFSFYVPASESDCYKDIVMERLGKFVTASSGSDITLCHENEKGIYGDVATRCLEIHQSFPEIRAVFDPANFVQCKQDTKIALEMLLPYIEYMHIKDATADGFVVPAGKGVGNIPYLLEKYKGSVLTIEPHLSMFDGFDKLEELEKSKSGYLYPTSDAAFDAAVNALKELI